MCILNLFKKCPAKKAVESESIKELTMDTKMLKDSIEKKPSAKNSECTTKCK